MELFAYIFLLGTIGAILGICQLPINNLLPLVMAALVSGQVPPSPQSPCPSPSPTSLTDSSFLYDRRSFSGLSPSSADSPSPFSYISSSASSSRYSPLIPLSCALSPSLLSFSSFSPPPHVLSSSLLICILLSSSPPSAPREFLHPHRVCQPSPKLSQDNAVTSDRMLANRYDIIKWSSLISIEPSIWR